jgi:hypothetical protein
VPFHVLIYKKNKLCRFLIWQLLYGWWVTTKDQSHPSVLYMYDWFFNRYVTPHIKKSIMTLLSGWLPPLFWVFSNWNCTLSFLLLSQVIIVHLCLSAVVTHHSQSNCLMRNRCSLMVKGKLTLKYLKICSVHPEFFRSITWNPVYPSSISWHYPFKRWGDSMVVAVTGMQQSLVRIGTSGARSKFRQAS